jgi:hypothetical protein
MRVFSHIDFHFVVDQTVDAVAQQSPPHLAESLRLP